MTISSLLASVHFSLETPFNPEYTHLDQSMSGSVFPHELCRLHVEEGGQTCASGKNFWRLAREGIAGPGLVSVLKPKAPPLCESKYQ